MAWCGFVGAWFLFAGPIFQAAIELEEEQFEREEFAATVSAVRPEPVSPWWWLLPPVMWAKQVRRNRAHQYDVLNALSTEQVEAFMSYSAKSTGWFLVGVGGFLIAVKETYELVEAMEWATFLVWVLILVAAFLSVLNAVFRMRRGQQVVQHRRAAEDTGGPAPS
jgi:hypothetical protein